MGWDVWSWSGYTVEALMRQARRDAELADMLGQIDVLVDGLDPNHLKAVTDKMLEAGANIELNENRSAVSSLRELCSGQRVTFIFAAKDVLRNGAVVLKEYLDVEF